MIYEAMISSKAQIIPLICLLCLSTACRANPDEANLLNELPFASITDARSFRMALTNEFDQEAGHQKSEADIFVDDIREDITVKEQYILHQIVKVHKGHLTEEEKQAAIAFQKSELKGVSGVSVNAQNDLEMAKAGLLTRLTDYRKALLEMKKDLDATDIPGEAEVDLSTYRLFRSSTSVRQWLALYIQRNKKNRKSKKLYWDFAALDEFVLDLSAQLQQMLPGYSSVLEKMCMVRVIKKPGRMLPANEYCFEIFQKLAQEAISLKNGLDELRGLVSGKALSKNLYNKLLDRAQKICCVIGDVLTRKNRLLDQSKSCPDQSRKGDFLFAGFVELSRKIDLVQAYLHGYKQDTQRVIGRTTQERYKKQQQKLKQEKVDLACKKEAERVERERKAREARALQKQLREMWRKMAAEEPEPGQASQVEVEPEETLDPSEQAFGGGANTKKARKDKLRDRRAANALAHQASLRSAKGKSKMKAAEPEVDWERHFGDVGHLSNTKKATLMGLYHGDARFKPNEIVPFLKSLGGDIASNGGSQRTVTFVGADGRLIKGIFHEHHGSNDEKGLRASIREILLRARFLPEKP